MVNQMGSNDQRSQPRLSLDLPATISIGSRLSIKGQLKDLSMNSAFIRIKNSIYLNVNDEIGISIQCSTDEAGVQIEGLARISRIVPGEGLAVYFTQLDGESLECIKKLFQKPPAS